MIYGNKFLHNPDLLVNYFGLSSWERAVLLGLLQIGYKEGPNNDNPFGKFF